MSNKLSQEAALIEMRKLVLEAEEKLVRAKELANMHSFTFTIGNATYDGSSEDWLSNNSNDDYWQSSGMNC